MSTTTTNNNTKRKLLVVKSSEKTLKIQEHNSPPNTAEHFCFSVLKLIDPSLFSLPNFAHSHA